jgi:hypothetical protein
VIPVILISMVMVLAVFVGSLKPHIIFLFSLIWLFLAFVFLLKGDQKTAELLSMAFYMLNVVAFVYNLFSRRVDDVLKR